MILLHGQEALFKHFTVKDGLPSNHIYAVHEDSQGYIWVCTPKGVAKYDGDRFRNFTVEDGLPTNDVWNILEDSENRLWLHFRGDELCYIQNDSIHIVPLDFHCEGSIIYEDKDSTKIYNNYNNLLFTIYEW